MCKDIWSIDCGVCRVYYEKTVWENTNSPIAMVWCIMDSCHKVTRSIRNTTLRKFRQKRTELWKNQLWILQHNNAPAHKSMLVHEFLAKNRTVIMPQPPADFLLFPKLKTQVKGKRFVTIEKIKKNRNRSCWRFKKLN